MKTFIVSTVLSLFFYSTFAVKIDSLFFGQNPPGDSAVIFAPGILSLPNRIEGNILFSHDGHECYFTVWGINFSSAKIFYTKLEGNVWSTQVETSFSKGYYADGGFISNDGNKLYFNRGSKPHICVVHRSTNGWIDPEILPVPFNSDKWDYCYSETTDGTVYFNSDRPGGQGHDTWRTTNVPGQPIQVVNLGSIINSAEADYCSFVSSDRSFLIFSSERPGGYSSSDLYVSFNKGNDDWTSPINLERNSNGINLKNSGGTGDPFISYDGQFLFFTRGGDIYWISTKFIADIKKEVFNKKQK